VNIANTKKVVKQAALKKVTPMLWGKAGIGKSEVIVQVCQEIAKESGVEFTKEYDLFDKEHFGLVDLRLGTQEVGDLIGIPRTAKSTVGGKEYERTIWALPSWFPVDPLSRGIIFLDELNRGRLEVIQAIFQLVLNRQLHTHKLPEGWSIVSACNPSGDNYFVNELDEALLDRFVNIQFTPEIKEWIEFGKNTGRISLGITDFVEKYPQALGTNYETSTLDIKPTPRSWEMLTKMLDGLEKDLWLEVASALIGTEFALSFINSLDREMDKPLRAEDILNDFDKHEKTIKKFANNKKSRTDLLRMTCDDIVRVSKQEDRVKFSKEQSANLLKFLKSIMADLAFSVVKELVKIDEMKDIFNKDTDLFAKLANARELDK
jgi:hypothetical protein